MIINGTQSQLIKIDKNYTHWIGSCVYIKINNQFTNGIITYIDNLPNNKKIFIYLIDSKTNISLNFEQDFEILFVSRTTIILKII